MGIAKTSLFAVGRFAVGLVAVGLVALGFAMGRIGRSDAPESAVRDESMAPEASSKWTCAMHPQVQLPEPGKCPICFMDLIPTPSDDAAEADGLGPRTLQMSEDAVALAEIETARVERRSVAHEVGMVGKIALDETRVAYITSWVSGRLDRLFVDYTGVTVRANDHLVEIYSPTLYSAQQELLQSIATAKKLEGRSLDILRSASDRTIVSAREKLRLYGLSDDQIGAIVEKGVPDQHVTIFAPIGGVVVHKNVLEGMYVEEGTRIYTIADLSKLWVVLDAYESDLAWLRYGQDVEFQVEAYPGEHFHGRVAFIDPLLDDRTRTVKVRLNVDNVGQRLKPDMFVSATAHAVLTSHGKVVDEDLADKWMCPMHPEVVADGLESCTECGMALVPAVELGFAAQPERGESIVIPATAPLITGKRAVVYVRLPDRERATFEGREIELGPRAGDWYVVNEGLEEGEEVVVYGNFKIDSELQIRARPSMMSAAGGAGSAGHQHGREAAQEDPPSAGEASTEAATNDEPQGDESASFRRQLGDVVDAFIQLHGELAADRDGRTAAGAVRAALDMVDPQRLADEQRRLWNSQLPALRDAVEALADAPELAARRARLAPATDRLAEALRTFGYERDSGEVGVFHCPMALDDAGANWLQDEESVANPYFGAEMRRCGSLVELVSRGN